MTATNARGLIQAVRTTQLDRVRDLLAQGVDPDLRSRGGRTALHAAAEEGILEAARLLVDAGAAIEARNFAGDTPLHCAARYGRGGDIMDPDADARPLQFDRKLHPDIAAAWAEERRSVVETGLRGKTPAAWRRRRSGRSRVHSRAVRQTRVPAHRRAVDRPRR